MSDEPERTSMSGTILLLNGPNLNLLGDREPAIYGTATLADHVESARAVAEAHGFELEHVQSNHVGDQIDALTGARGRCAAIVFNAGAFPPYPGGLSHPLGTDQTPVLYPHTPPKP